MFQIQIEQCETGIKSIEIQLVRVETCGCAEGFAKDGTAHVILSLHWEWTVLQLSIMIIYNSTLRKLSFLKQS